MFATSSPVAAVALILKDAGVPVVPIGGTIPHSAIVFLTPERYRKLSTLNSSDKLC